MLLLLVMRHSFPGGRGSRALRISGGAARLCARMRSARRLARGFLWKIPVSELERSDFVLCGRCAFGRKNAQRATCARFGLIPRDYFGGSTTTLSISRVVPTRAATAKTVGPVIVSTGFSVTVSTAAT
jgi:hypothetical protein